MFTHDTSDQNVKMYVDSIQKINETKRLITGWILHSDSTITSLKLSNGEDISFTRYRRPDVIEVYTNIVDDLVGFQLTLDESNIFENISIQLVDGTTIKEVFSFDKWCVYYSGFSKDIKNLIVVDDFYEDPELIRQFAIQRVQYSPSGYHKGQRSNRFILEGTKEKFEQIIGRKIRNWNYEGYANGVFQFCVESDPIVYHVDSQTFAAIVFLSPEAPLDTGTATYKSKKTGVRRLDDEDTGKQVYFDTFSNDKGEYDFYDESRFELVDRVANVYNRLVIFDAKCIHAAMRYYGSNVSDSRLFQIFFFDID